MGVNRNKQTGLRTSIGTVLGKHLRFIAYVRDCAKDNCPLKDICPFKPKGKCTVEYNFLTALYNSWIDPMDGVGDRLTQAQFDRLGTHLMPLYQQLIRFSMETFKLENVTYVDPKGITRPYPQFREIREILKAIDNEMSSIGLEKAWKEKFDNKKPLPVGKGATDIEGMMDGRPGAYEDMQRRAGIKDE
jgi:hypothetical protein